MRFSMRHIFFLLVFCFSFYAEDVFATHYRAGEITYELIAPFTYRVTVRTIAEDNAADRDTIRVRWGDGSLDELLSRTNGPIIGGSHKGEPVGFGFKRNIYIGTHTFPGVPPPPRNYYVISFYDPARVNNVININNGNSVDVPFFVEDTLRFPADVASIGYNSSPVFFQDPFDYGNVNEVFTHSLNPFDPDGDSLTFDITTPLLNFGSVVPNWRNPQNVPMANDPNNVFALNRQTGEIVWTTPQRQGLYNVGILIREYRRGILMGTILRDFHIIIESRNNIPPKVSELNDTCIRAGDMLQMLVSASDLDISQIVTLTADGAPFFDAPNPLAVFNAQPPGNPTSGNFSWQPSCNQVRKQPYTVVFKAQDNFAQGGNKLPLTDAETWLIEVVAPPVQNVAATVAGSTVNISWQNPYFCSSANNFRGFSVWRKINSNPFTPEYCETGLDGRGYTRLNSTLTQTYNFADNNIVRGQQYCYRILAHFSRLSPNGIFEYDMVESVPSIEVCVNVPLDIPVITNVSVNTTDVTNGSNFVAWSKPRAGANQLDTLQNLPPYVFDVYRGSGFNLTSPVFVQSYSANSFFAMNDTTFTDTLLDTRTTANSYKIVFKANGDSLGETTVASSVFLSISPSDKSLRLNWEENVPWTNDSFAIFRQNKSTLLFDSIAVSHTHQYIDTGLINDTSYCYYIKSFGHYSVAGLKHPIINLSQQNCGAPQDTIAPCPPILAVRNDCEKYSGKAWSDSVFSNILSFNFAPQAGCDNDAVLYKIYFSETDNNLSLIDSTVDTTYTHLVQENIAGCYAVTAVDRVGNESARSNQVCIENCSFYELPNTFTPNGDGQNDVFTPFMPYRFVTRVEFSVFNRWGNKVFETTDPNINWDGRDYKTGVLLNDGLYLYGGFYYERQRSGEVKKVLPPNKKGGGYIHLIRGN
jgi:gliding motility-associated-like protein